MNWRFQQKAPHNRSKEQHYKYGPDERGIIKAWLADKIFAAKVRMESEGFFQPLRVGTELFWRH
jgi:hypothetical protein